MASRNGHNPDLGEAFMNKEKEVKIGDRVVHAKGSLLTLNAQEASEDNKRQTVPGRRDRAIHR